MKIGIADTTFARIDMGQIALDAISESGEKIEIKRITVPGVKDLPVACKKLLEEEKCDIALACGWVGGQEIDKTCAHEASLGLIQAQLMANKHILGAFVFEMEAKTDGEMEILVKDRVSKHALNCIDLILHPERLKTNAGSGFRQGSEHSGRLVVK